MANVGTLTANLIAQTTNFNRPLESAQRKLEQFEKKTEQVEKRLDAVSKVGRKAAAAFTALSGALFLGVKNTASYGYEIELMSQRTGLAESALQEMQYVADQLGFDFDNLQQMTSQLGQKIVEAETAGGAMATAFKALGISTRTTSGQLRSMDELFEETITALSRMDNAVERNALAVKIFGEEGRKLIPLLSAGQDEIDRLRRQARELGFVMADASIRDLANFQREISTVGQSLRATGREILAQFVPAMRVVLDWVNRGVSWFRNLSSEQMRAIKQWVALTALILGLVAAFGAFAKVAVIVVKGVRTVVSIFKAVQAVIFGVQAVFAVLGGSTILIIGAIIAAIVGLYLAWKNNWFGIRGVITGVWEDHIKPILDVVLEWGAKTLSTVWNWAVEAAGRFWDWFIDVGWPWIGKVLDTAWNWTLGVLGTFYKWLVEKAIPWIGGELSTVWDWSLRVFGAFYDWLVEKGWPMIKETLATTWNWTMKVLGVFWEWLANTAWPWLGKVAGTIWEWTFKILGRFAEWLILEAFPFVFEVILTTWQWAFEFIGKFLIWLIEEGFPLIGKTISTIWEWTFNVLGKSWEWLTDKAIPWMGDTVKTTWEWSFKAFGKLWDWIEKGADWIGGTVQTTLEFTEKGLGAVRRGLSTVGSWFGFQRGGILPGIAGPDMFPALLAPGEAIIPADVWRKGLSAVAAWFRRLGVPGFQAGGILGESANAGAAAVTMIDFSELEASIDQQSSLVRNLGKTVKSIPEAIVSGLFALFDGLISIIDRLATSVFGEEQAQRITGTLHTWQDEMKRLLGTLGFFDEETEDAAETVAEGAAVVAAASEQVRNRFNLLTEASRYVWNALNESIPVLKRGVELYQTSVLPVINELGQVVRQGASRIQALAMVALDLIMQSSSFSRLIEIVNSVLASFIDALGMVISPLLPLAQVVADILTPLFTTIGTILSSLLVPAFQVLFPILKIFGSVIIGVAQAVGTIWNAILDMISLLPFVDLRKYKVDLQALQSASRDLANLTLEEARARAENTKAIEESTRAMVNVPSVFRIAMRRAQAADVLASVATPLQTGGIITRPMVGLLGEAGPEAVVPLGRSGQGLTINVHLNGPVYGMNDFQRAVEEAMSLAARKAGLGQYGLVVKFT